MADVAKEYFKVYEEYSKELRTWFVAYGIGAPALILTNDTISKAIKAAGASKCIAAFFLIGVSLQISLAVINKVAMWGMYYGAVESAFQTTRSYKFADWIADQFWIDILIDIITLISFAGGTWKIFNMIA